ncbi:hypothetical protein UFOVP629_74 [uncultured Caudovirales phage]|uniref:Uncharacterized protein n=1 Tax=uncultured Caudovirales phage TaxID=2100421 RepID=A0A6J5N624_9CAUD|nr:hypothetical protein UFOVP629_74 [uncultured Caudovirales phage]
MAEITEPQKELIRKLWDEHHEQLNSGEYDHIMALLPADNRYRASSLINALLSLPKVGVGREQTTSVK